MENIGNIEKHIENEAIREKLIKNKFRTTKAGKLKKR